MKVEQYQRTEKIRPLNAKQVDFVQDKSGQIWGEAIGRVGETLGSYAAKMKQEADEMRADEAFSKYRQGHIDRAYGENGYQSLKGEAAINVAAKARDALAKDYEKLTESMSASQVKLFSRKALAFNDSVEQSMMQYEFTQGQAHKKASSIGLVQASMEQGRKLYKDPQMFPDAVIDFESKAQRHYQVIEGLSGVALAEAMKKCESQFFKGIVEQAISDNPNNPTVASNLIKTYKEKGLLLSDDEVALKKMIQPSVDAYEIETMSSKYLSDALNADKNAHDGETFHHGRKLDVTSQILEIQNSKLDPKKKQSLIYSINFKANLISDKRIQENTDIYDRVNDQAYAGTDVTTLGDFHKLTPEQQNSIISGASLKGSDQTVVSRLDELLKNNDLKNDDYLPLKHRLSKSDRSRYENWIQSSSEKRIKEAQTYRLSDQILSKAFRIATGDKAKPTSADFISLQANLAPIIREMVLKGGVESIDPNSVANKIKDITKDYFKEQDALIYFDLARNYNQIATRQREADMGRGKAVEVKDLILVGDNSIPLSKEDNEKIKSLIADSIQKKGGVANALGIARIWVKMQRSPNGAAQIQKLIGQKQNTGD